MLLVVQDEWCIGKQSDSYMYSTSKVG